MRTIVWVDDTLLQKTSGENFEMKHNKQEG